MAHPLGVATAETLTGNRTLTFAEIDQYAIWLLDPGGAGRDLTLPSESTSVGHIVIVVNTADAAEVITIKNSSGTAVCTPTQAETAIVFCDGSDWQGIVGANS